MSNKKSVGILTILNLIGVFISALYSVLQAVYFGVSRDIEIFFAATMVMRTFMALTQEGQLAEILLPSYHETKRERGEGDARKVFSIIMNWMSVFVLLIAAITWILAPWFVDFAVPGFTEEDKVMIVAFTRFLVFFLLVDLGISLFNTLFNAEKNFGVPESINLFNSIVSIFLLVLLFDKLGVWVLVISLTVGKVVNLILYFFVLRKMKYRHYWKFSMTGFDHWGFFKKMFNGFIFVATSQFHLIIMSAGLSLLPQGYYAVYNFVNKLYSKFNGVLLRPVAIVFFTRFSELVKGDVKTLRSELNTAILYNFIIAFYSLYFIIICGNSFLSFIWGSEKFSPEFIHYAHLLFILFLITFIFDGMSLIYRKLIMSFKFSKEQFLWTSLIQLFKALLAWLILPDLGFAGLLLIVFLNRFLFGMVPMIIAHIKLPQFSMGVELSYILKRLIILIICSLIVFAMFYPFDLKLGESKISDFIIASMSFVIGTLLLIPFAKLLKFEEYNFIVNYLRKKLPILKK